MFVLFLMSTDIFISVQKFLEFNSSLAGHFYINKYSTSLSDDNIKDELINETFVHLFYIFYILHCMIILFLFLCSLNFIYFISLISNNKCLISLTIIIF